MKKMSRLLLILTSFYGFAQNRTTGVVTLTNNMTVNLTLNSATSKATLVLTGPSDRWFALQFGIFGSSGGMRNGQDFVYYTGSTTLVDGNMIGLRTPLGDASQDWTISSNNVVGTTRTITATRNLVTGDAKDYAFSLTNPTIDFAWARAGGASYTFSNHNSNFGYNVSRSFSTLGVEDFSLETAAVYPNPSNGSFSITAKTGLKKINVYTQIGAFVESIGITGNPNQADVNLKGLQNGIYLIELEGETGKAWKKIAINN